MVLASVLRSSPGARSRPRGPSAATHRRRARRSPAAAPTPPRADRRSAAAARSDSGQAPPCVGRPIAQPLAQLLDLLGELGVRSRSIGSSRLRLPGRSRLRGRGSCPAACRCRFRRAPWQNVSNFAGSPSWVPRTTYEPRRLPAFSTPRIASARSLLDAKTRPPRQSAASANCLNRLEDRRLGYDAARSDARQGSSSTSSNLVLPERRFGGPHVRCTASRGRVDRPRVQDVQHQRHPRMLVPHSGSGHSGGGRLSTYPSNFAVGSAGLRFCFGPGGARSSSSTCSHSSSTTWPAARKSSSPSFRPARAPVGSRSEQPRPARRDTR